MRDSEIDSLSADGAQEPEVALQAPAPSPAAELDLSLHPPDCACPDCTAAYEKGRAAAEPCTPSNPHAECRYANSGTRWHCYRAAAEGKEE